MHSMIRTARVIGLFLGWLVPWADIPGQSPRWGVVLAADSLKLDGLSQDPRQFRMQVDQILAKAQALVLDLMQTRDNISRKIPKIDAAPGDAKWSSQEMRDSVQAMLMPLKDRYENTAELAA
ncbi:MAG: hypothetical protein C4293_10160 [Nitrospiraceae bacterium]